VIPFEQHLNRYEGKQPPPLPPPSQKPRNGDLKKAGLAVLGALGLLAVIGQIGISSDNAAEKAAPTCTSDFTKCVDIRDMANHFKEWRHAAFDCKWEADKRAKYGTPEWSSLYTFGKFYNGPITGTATLIDDDVKFQNGFGAMAHSEVHCEYDFRAKKVINVSITQK